MSWRKTVDIEDDLRSQIDGIMHRTGQSFKQTVNNLIGKGLAKTQAQKVPRKKRKQKQTK